MQLQRRSLRPQHDPPLAGPLPTCFSRTSCPGGLVRRASFRGPVPISDEESVGDWCVVPSDDTLCGERPSTSGSSGRSRRARKRWPWFAGSTALTYAELNARANRLAHRLRARGRVRSRALPSSLERSLDLVVGILGILKAGGAYLPLDPDYPKDRVTVHGGGCGGSGSWWPGRRRLGHGGGPGGHLRGRRRAGRGGRPGERGAPSSLAYVIYTSGSTGRPKGVRSLMRT